MPAPIPFAMRPTHTRGADAPAPPPPGIFAGLLDPEVFGANVRTARDDIPGHLEEERTNAYMGIVTALTERGQRPERYYLPEAAGIITGGAPLINFDLVWQDAQRAGLAGLPATREEFDRRWQGGMERRQGRDAQVAARGGIAARLFGGVVGGFGDPINLATMPFGGGSRWWTQLLIEGAINAGTELVETPLINVERARQGRPEMTGEEVATNVVVAAGAGAAFRGATMLPGAARAGFERAVAASWDRLPEGLRQRWGARAELPLPEQDALMADMAEAVIGPDNLSEAERAAAALLRRSAQVDAVSPFAPSGAAAELHPRLLGEALRTILDENPASVRPTPSVLEGGGRASRLRTTTAITSRTVQPGDAGVPAQQAFKNRVRRQESSGNDAARNPRSSAEGRYQFTDGTWLAYYRRRFGRTGESDAQILAKKRDGALQERLMDDLTADNAAFLRSRGEAVTEGNLYLVHFAGQGGAGKLLAADPQASARSVLGDAVVNANPHLNGMTAGEVIAWAHRAMGAPPSRRAGARPEVRVGEEAERAALQQEIDAIDARLDALRERPPGGPTASLLEGEDTPPAADFANVLDPIEDAELQARDPDLPDIPPFMPELAAVVADKGRSLNAIDEIAAELGVSTDQVRAGLDQLVADGTILRRRDTGTYMRKPPAPARGPRSLLEFIADRGGIEDRGGDFGAMGGAAWHRKAPFRARLLRDFDEASFIARGPDQQGRLHSAEAHFEAAISAGYFPELQGRLDQGGSVDMHAEKPDVALFHAAVERELAGDALYPVDSARYEAELERPSAATVTRLDQFTDEPWEDARARFHEQWAAHGNDPADLPDAVLDRAEGFYAYGDAATPEAAVQMAIAEEISLIRGRAFYETADAMYGRAYDPFDPNWEERLAADAEFQREFERAAAVALADAGGGGGRTAEPRDAGPRGADGADAVRAAEDGYAQGQRLAALEPAERAPFLDPDGEAAKAQVASLDHDARALAERLTAEKAHYRPGFAAVEDVKVYGVFDTLEESSAALDGFMAETGLPRHAFKQQVNRGDGKIYVTDVDAPGIVTREDALAEPPGTRTPSTAAGAEAWDQASIALSDAVDEHARRTGKETGADLDEDLIDEVAQEVMAGRDPLVRARQLIKDGRLKLVEGELPPAAEVKPLPPSGVVPAPERTVLSAERAGPELPPERAAEQVAQWKAEAARIGAESPPPPGSVILSLFDESGRFSQPYRDMGYEVYQLDLKHGYDLLRNMPELLEVLAKFKEGGARIVGVLAQPPCTTFAGSGARWWTPRHDRAWSNMVRSMWGDWAAKRFASPVEYNQFLVAATEEVIGASKPEFFVIENPVGRIERLAGLPAPQMVVQPHHFGDPYTKRTHLWGKFSTELPTAPVHPSEGSRVHKLRGRDEKEAGLRSLTPEGFAYAFALANRPGTEAAKLDLGAAVDPAIAARQAQEAQLGADAPLQAPVAQQSTLGLGLFGAADGVRLDAEGEARPLKDLLDELDAEAAELKTLRDCLD